MTTVSDAELASCQWLNGIRSNDDDADNDDSIIVSTNDDGFVLLHRPSSIVDGFDTKGLHPQLCSTVGGLIEELTSLDVKIAIKVRILL